MTDSDLQDLSQSVPVTPTPLRRARTPKVSASMASLQAFSSSFFKASRLSFEAMSFTVQSVGHDRIHPINSISHNWHQSDCFRSPRLNNLDLDHSSQYYCANVQCKWQLDDLDTKVCHVHLFYFLLVISNGTWYLLFVNTKNVTSLYAPALRISRKLPRKHALLWTLGLKMCTFPQGRAP